jgi:hypothetical protein
MAKAARESAAMRLRRAVLLATQGVNCINYLLRMPAGLAVGLALKESCASTDSVD